MKINIWYFIIVAVVLFAVLKQCEGKPRTITKTVTKIETIYDTINNTIIKEIPKKVYIEKTKKGDTVVVYKDKPSETTIETSQFEVELLSNDASAMLTITANELYDVQGVITYPRIETTTETIKIRDASGLFIYGSMPISSQINPELGAMFQIKNKIIIGAGVQYNDFTKKLDAKATIAIKVW